MRPALPAWADLARNPPGGVALGRSLAAWRAETRRELGLPGPPLVVTGHQSLLWHPGILIKYIALEAVAAAHGLARANLIVDQHALTARGSGDFGAFEVPVRRADGGLAVRRIELTRPRPDVPMARHAAFAPAALPPALPAALPAVAEGVQRIHDAVARHQDAASAALQMGAALGELMRPWVAPAPSVTSSDLMRTSFARALLAAMAEDPQRCAVAYNAAVAAVPEARIAPLLVRDDYVELPLWRIRDDGRRVHAYDHDVEAAVAGAAGAPALLPRALGLTALVRLALSDLFVHGLGGAAYDGAMERWIGGWLGVRPGPIAVASATVHLPLRPPPAERLDRDRERASARWAWHDPEPEGAERPGPVKRELLEAIAAAPARSSRRRAAFFAMHRELATLRSVHVGLVERRQRRAEAARRQAADAGVAGRRDWPFPVYPAALIDALAAAVGAAVGAPAPAGPARRA